MPATAVPTPAPGVSRRTGSLTVRSASRGRSVRNWAGSGRSAGPRTVRRFSAASAAFTSESPLLPALGRVRAPVERPPRALVPPRLPCSDASPSRHRGRAGHRPRRRVAADGATQSTGRRWSRADSCTPPPRWTTAPSWSPDGLGDGFVLRSAELYRPDTRTWQATGPMTTERYYDAAAGLADGRVLVMGGVNDNVELLSSAEVYDPASGDWTETGALQEGRAPPHRHDARRRSRGGRRWAGARSPQRERQPRRASRSSTPRPAPGRSAGTWTRRATGTPPPS